MPVLPLIDLLILIAWSALFVAFVEKASALAVATRIHLFGLTPFDWVVVSGVCLLFALALAARVWVKTAEPALLKARREWSLRGAGAEVLPDFPDPREQIATPAEVETTPAEVETTPAEVERTPAEVETAPALAARRATGR